MADKPILMNGAMVRATLAGTKTQTRRIAKAITEETCYVGLEGHEGFVPVRDDGRETPILCPYGVGGNRLWVRETWAPLDEMAMTFKEPDKIFYRADDETKYESDLTWRPSIHMPRWASRITLEITGIRLELLNDISDKDCFAEGIQSVVDAGRRGGDGSVRGEFRALWDSINGKKCQWSSNPFVWVVEFKVATVQPELPPHTHWSRRRAIQSVVKSHARYRRKVADHD